MASICDFALKNIKEFVGEEGYGLTASMYLQGIFLIYCNYVVAMTMTNSKYCIYIEKHLSSLDDRCLTFCLL